MIQFDIFTIFPGMFDGPLGESIVARAVRAGLVSWQTHNIRDYATDKHKTTDDVPYGGGGGMVMKVEPWWAGGWCRPRSADVEVVMTPRAGY